MKAIFVRRVAGFLRVDFTACCCWCLMTSASLAVEPDWVPLFNGKDTTGWTATLRPPKDKPQDKPDPADTWTVHDGALCCTGKPTGYLATEKSYENYELKLKWRYAKGTTDGKSGILLHLGVEDSVWPESIEAQLNTGAAGDIWLNPNSRKELPKITIPAVQKDTANAAGRHYLRLETGRTPEKKHGEWNEYSIVCDGGKITLTINEIVVNQASGCSLVKGRIGLQSEGTPVEFREIHLKVLAK